MATGQPLRKYAAVPLPCMIYFQNSRTPIQTGESSTAGNGDDEAVTVRSDQAVIVPGRSKPSIPELQTVRTDLLSWEHISSRIMLFFYVLEGLTRPNTVCCVCFG